MAKNNKRPKWPTPVGPWPCYKPGQLVHLRVKYPSIAFVCHIMERRWDGDFNWEYTTDIPGKEWEWFSSNKFWPLSMEELGI